MAQAALELAEAAEAARAEGKVVGESWLVRQARYEQLLAEIEQRLGQLALRAPVEVLQREAIADMQGTVREAVEAGLAGGPADVRRSLIANWFTLPVAATEELIGNTAQGRPLRTLLEDIAPATRHSAETVLQSGIARGQNPRIVAREMERVTSASYTRLETITRTEMLRAQRQAASRLMVANSQVVQGWTWVCALDQRSCSACIAMHGSEHPPGEVLDDHPRGRCGMAPKTRPWSELGYPEGRDLAPMQTGPEWFDTLSRAEQDRVLGAAKAEAIRSGEVGWPDLVKRTTNPAWGSMRREASMREAVASAGRP